MMSSEIQEVIKSTKLNASMILSSIPAWLTILFVGLSEQSSILFILGGLVSTMISLMIFKLFNYSKILNAVYLFGLLLLAMILYLRIYADVFSFLSPVYVFAIVAAINYLLVASVKEKIND